MKTKKTADILEDRKPNVKVKLALLWVASSGPHESGLQLNLNLSNQSIACN